MADVVFALGSLLFAVALGPSVLRRLPPARSTCILTASVLTVFVAAYGSLHFWFAMGTDAATATLWWVLFAETFAQPGRERGELRQRA